MFFRLVQRHSQRVQASPLGSGASRQLLSCPRRLFAGEEGVFLEFKESGEVYPQLKNTPSKELHSFLRMFQGNKAVHDKMVKRLSEVAQTHDAISELRREKDILSNINEQNEGKLAELRGLLEQQEIEGPEVAKRWEGEMAKAKTFALTNFAKEALEIMDNLQRSQASLEKSFKDVPGKESIVKLLKDVQLHLEETFASYDVRKMEVNAGDPVDPNFHHIITFIPFPGRENDSIVDVIQVGYNIGSRVLRPAKVVVVKN